MVAAGLTKILIKKLIVSFKIVTYFVSGLPFNKNTSLGDNITLRGRDYCSHFINFENEAQNKAL